MDKQPSPIKSVGRGITPPGQRTRSLGSVDDIYREAMFGDNEVDRAIAQGWAERFGGPFGDPRNWEMESRLQEMPGITRSFRAWEDTLNTMLPRARGFPRRARVSNLDFEGGGERLTGGATHGAVSRGRFEIAGNAIDDQKNTLAHEQYHARNPSRDPFDPSLHAAVSALYRDPAIRQELQKRSSTEIPNTEEYRASLYGHGTRALGQILKEKNPLAYMQKLERVRPLQGRAMLAIAEQSPYHKKAADILRQMGFTPPEKP